MGVDGKSTRPIISPENNIRPTVRNVRELGGCNIKRATGPCQTNRRAGCVRLKRYRSCSGKCGVDCRISAGSKSQIIRTHRLCAVNVYSPGGRAECHIIIPCIGPNIHNSRCGVGAEGNIVPAVGDESEFRVREIKRSSLSVADTDCCGIGHVQKAYIARTTERRADYGVCIAAEDKVISSHALRAIDGYYPAVRAEVHGIVPRARADIHGSRHARASKNDIGPTVVNERKLRVRKIERTGLRVTNPHSGRIR